MPDPSSTCRAELQRAESQLADIAELERNKAFQTYYLPRLRSRIKDLERSILGKNLPPESYSSALSALHALIEMDAMLEQDAIACRSILGLKKGELSCMSLMS